MKFFLIFSIFVSFVFANENSYVFEAKGDFAKELKALVEKYSQEENVTIKVYEKKSSSKKGILNIFSDEDQDYADPNLGKELYAKKCASCHGVDGSTSAYGTSKKLTKMSAEEIKIAFNSYLQDSYGGSMKFIMKNEVVKTTDDELESIVSFLKNTNSTKDYTNKSETSKEEPTQGTYLK